MASEEMQILNNTAVIKITALATTILLQDILFFLLKITIVRQKSEYKISIMQS